MPADVEVRGQLQLPSSVTLHFILETWALPMNLVLVRLSGSA